jgi:toxin ParE1/3/4
MVRWSRRARDDLKAIHDRIATDSPITAKSVVRQIWSQADTLASVSLRGRAVPEVNDASLREVPVSAWRLIYQVRNEQRSSLLRSSISAGRLDLTI